MSHKIKRIAVTALIVIVAFLADTSIFERLSIASVTPNIMIIVTASFGFMRGSVGGMTVGFFCGLLIDVVFGDYIGFYALCYALIGYINGFFRRIFYPEDVKLPLILIGGSDILLGHIICVFRFIVRSRLDYGYYLAHVIIPEFIYTVLVAILLYQVILKINTRLEEAEKRSESKFV